MTDIGNLDRPLKVGQVWLRKEADEAAIYDPGSETLHMLNPTALAIWELCDGETTSEEIVGAIHEVSDAPLAQIESDVSSALERLEAIGVIEWTREA